MSASGTGFYKWVGTEAFVLPSGGSGNLILNVTGTGCSWELYFEGGDVNGITLPGDGSLNLSGTSTGTTVSIPITVASGAASGFTTESRGATWQIEVNGSIIAGFGIYQNSSGCAATLSPSSAPFTAAGGTTTFDLEVPYCWYDYSLTPSGENWLSASISTSSGVVQLTGSGPSFLYGTITVTAAQNNTTSTRSASFNVLQPNSLTFAANQAAGTAIDLIASPSPLTVTSPPNGPNINSSINLTSSNSSTPVDVTSISDDSTATWDLITLTPGNTPLSLPVVFYPAGLSVGKYTDTLVVNSSATNSPLQIPITFYIAEPLTVNCTPASLGLQGTLEVGVPFSTTCQINGGIPPYVEAFGIPRFGSTGGSLSSNGSSFTYSGTPTAAGSYSVPILVSDNSSQSATAAFSGTIDPALQIQSLLPIPTAVAGFAYGPVSFASVSGGRGAGTYVWSSGSVSLPSGLGMDISTGAISGTPAVGTDGSYALGYKVTDGLGTISGSFPAGSLVILPPPSLTSSSNSSGGGGSVGTTADLTPTPITLNSSNQAPITFSVNSQTSNTLGGNWLNLNISSLTTSQANPATLTATANLVGLAIGTYTATVTLTPTSLHSGGAQIIQLTATVFGTDSLNIKPSPVVGQLLQVTSATPASGTISVTALPTAPLFFSTASSMTTQPGANWLSISPNGATTSAGAQVETNTVVNVNFTPGSLPPGPYDGVVTIYDTLQTQYPVSVRLVIPYPPVKITGPSTIPAGTIGSAYTNTTVMATGGNSNYTWSATGLPNTLSINASTGVISGTPTVPFNGTVTVSVADTESPAQTDSKMYSLSVTYPALSITNPQSLPQGTVGSAYQSTTVTAGGGNGTYKWSAPGLPGGLSINANGVISGTPNAAFNSTVTVSVSDTESPAMNASKTYSLTVVYPALSINNPPSLPGGTVGSAYPSTTVTATGGNGNYNWSATGLPNGLTIDANTGVIGGTPKAGGNNLPVKVTVSDTESPAMTASQTYSLTVVYPVLSIKNPQSLPQGTVGSAYPATTITATGGNGNYNWSATGLPIGMNIDANSGVIGGTPNAGGNNLSVKVTVSDTESPAMTASQTYSLTVVYGVLSIANPQSLPGGTVGSAYPNTAITATGGNGNYTWSASGLPNGMNIDANTGVIGGTPNAAGNNVSVKVTVTDTESPAMTASKTYSLTVVYPTLSITNPQSLPGGTVASAYPNTTLMATGGNGNYTWSASGLPNGMSINAGTGVIGGTPGTGGNNLSVTVTVTDNESPAMMANKTYSLTVVYAALLIAGPQSLPGDTVGAAYQSTAVKATGGDGNYMWSETGLPDGLGIDPNTGVIGGTPNVAGSNLNVKVTVTDGESPRVSTSTSYTLTIDPALVIAAPASLPEGTDGAAYPTTTVSATGGNGNYTWSAPGLPDGLRIDANTGIVSGTPHGSFNGNVTVTVTDNESPPASTSKSYAVIINAELVITGPASLPAATVNVAYPTPTITTTGGTPPFTWSATGLPAGLRIDPANGNITGVPPTAAGSPFSPQITVRDALMVSATKTYNPVTVGPGPLTVCQVAHTASTGVADIQTMIQEALGLAAPANILNGGGVANVVGVQVVVDAVVGYGCLTTGTSVTLGQPPSPSISVGPSVVSTDLGTLGGASTVAFAINDLGQVVGSSAIGQPPLAHAFLWAAGRITDLSLPLANAAGSVALGVNGAGRVVGTYWSGSGDSAGFFYDRGITASFPNLIGGIPRAINESGEVVGSGLADGVSSHAFLWSGGMAADLGTLGGSESQACCINNTGLIAGSSQVAGDLAVHAFLYDGASLADLGTLGGTESVATGINDAGQVVGYSAGHAFLYGGGLMMDLGTLGGSHSQADGINQAGQVVGWAETADGARHACLWSAGRVIDLNGAAAERPGVVLLEATAINDAGQIVANGANGSAYLIALPAQAR